MARKKLNKSITATLSSRIDQDLKESVKKYCKDNRIKIKEFYDTLLRNFFAQKELDYVQSLKNINTQIKTLDQKMTFQLDLVFALFAFVVKELSPEKSSKLMVETAGDLLDDYFNSNTFFDLLQSLAEEKVLKQQSDNLFEEEE